MSRSRVPSGRGLVARRRWRAARTEAWGLDRRLSVCFERMIKLYSLPRLSARLSSDRHTGGPDQAV
jgi:hypothetical protein